MNTVDSCTQESGRLLGNNIVTQGVASLGTGLAMFKYSNDDQNDMLFNSGKSFNGN